MRVCEGRVSSDRLPVVNRAAIVSIDLAAFHIRVTSPHATTYSSETFGKYFPIQLLSFDASAIEQIASRVTPLRANTRTRRKAQMTTRKACCPILKPVGGDNNSAR